MDDILERVSNIIERHVEDLERFKREDPDLSKKLNDDYFIQRFKELLEEAKNMK